MPSIKMCDKKNKIAGRNLVEDECKLSLVAEFDDLMRAVRQSRNDVVEDILMNVVEKVSEMCDHWRIAVQECRRLQSEMDKKLHECSDLESKLIIARKLLDQEKRNRRQTEKDRENLESQISRVRDILLRDNRTRISDEAREQLSFLNVNMHPKCNGSPDLSIIKEVNTTGSLLSNFSCSYSEDDLDTGAMQSGKGWKIHRPSMEGVAEPAPKRRRSGNNKIVEISNTEKVKATTTVTVSKRGPITATSVIESVPFGEPATPNRHKNFAQPSAPPVELISDIWQASPTLTQTNIASKQHSFQPKTLVMPDVCTVCEKRTRFGKTVLKCKICRALCHPECKDLLPLPCIPSVHTPTQRNAAGIIGDYTPTAVPMVPAIIVHCLREIEQRGLNELGLYRIPGSERDVKALKEKFLRGRGVPNLSQVDLHVICGTLKDFLRSLSEPLVTYKLWGEFVKAVDAKDAQDVEPAFYQIISELPQPNRDTLAYMILHLKRIADAKDCKMPTENLAKVFGPTIVGYSSNDTNPSTIITETRQQVEVMMRLINLPTEYWSKFIDVDPKTPRLQQTPSTDSLLRPSVTRTFFSPYSNTLRRPRKLPTPPFL